jgi:rRNA maturation RNase YbeY
MLRVNIVTDTRYPVNRKTIRKAIADTLNLNKMLSGELEVSVAVVGKRKMGYITDEFVKDGKSHEVLAFPFEELTQELKSGFINSPDGILRLGDIVLCWPEVLLSAARDDVLVDDEVYTLTAHAVEHLLGNHHE